jgi:hypothetical protein
MSKRFLVAWIVIFIAWFLGSFVVHGVLLRSDYMNLMNLFRAEAEQQKYRSSAMGSSYAQVIPRRNYSD